MTPSSSSDTDYEVRLSLLKLADLVFRGAEESPPKMTIHIPRTPVTEMPPTLPSPAPIPKLGPKTKRIKLPGGKAAELPAPPGLAKIRIPSHIDKTPAPRAASPVVPPPLAKPAVPKKEVVFAAPKPPKAKVNPVATGLPKKPKAALQAQASGMSLNDLRACRNALKKIQGTKHSRLFAIPVDPVRDHAPKYVSSSIILLSDVLMFFLATSRLSRNLWISVPCMQNLNLELMRTDLLLRLISV